MSTPINPKHWQKQTRINNTLTNTIEKQVLLWLAARMPAWVGPDTLTMIGLAASLVIFLGYALTSIHPQFLWLASLGFIINWFGDSLDGTLARYRKIERPRYGFFVDHIIDSVSVVFIFLGLGFSPYVRFDLALIALTAYLLMSIYVYLATYVNNVFRISYGGLGPTEFRLIAITINTIVFFTGNNPASFKLPFNSTVSLTFYDLFGIVTTLVLTLMFLVSAIQTSLVLAREDHAALRARQLEQAHKNGKDPLHTSNPLLIPQTGGKDRSSRFS